MGKKLTLEIVKNRLSKINPNIEILSNEYINSEEKMSCRCKIDNHVWTAKWANLSQGKGCPMCSGSITLTLEEVLLRVRKINDKIEILDKVYINSEKKMSCKCLICDHKWKTNWESLRKGIGCPSCAGNLKLTLSGIKTILKNNNSTVEIISKEYKNANSKLNVKCTICGNEWFSPWATLKKGCSCLLCSHTAPLSMRIIKTRLYDINKSIKIIDNIYINTTTKLTCSCKVCGHIFEKDWGHLSRGQGCPKCVRSLGSFRKSEWKEKGENSASFDSFKIYLIQCWNEYENFYKIGRTFQKTKYRFGSKTQMPYNYRILDEIVGDADYIYDLETQLKRKNDEHHYTPKNKFGGHKYECFDCFEYWE